MLCAMPGALEISLVAEKDEEIAGHVAFSPSLLLKTAKSSGMRSALFRWSPDLQKSGIGSALINQGLGMLQDRKAAGCVLVGNPDYYSRFQFEVAPECCPDGEPAEYFQMLPIETNRPDHVVGFHKLFHAGLN